MDATRRRLVWHALPALVVLLALTQHALLLLLLRAVYWLFVRIAQLVVVLVGSGSFWWVLRSYQLQKEQELYDQAWSRYNFYQRYRHRSSSGRTSEHGYYGGSGAGSSNGSALNGGLIGAASGILDASFQLKAAKRLPIGAHLRTSWSLPQEICDEIALFVQLAIRDYVSYWFQPISPSNEDFPNDLKFLLADLLGALTARVLEIDSSQALAIAANAIEMLRLHLGWFREAYAQLEEDFPEVFQGDESDENLQKRQEYVAAFAQKSQFLHPGCVVTPSATDGSSSAASASFSRKPGQESPEVIYLRHVASQVLVQLKPELGYQYETSVFVSMIMNLMRETATFKILKPMADYSQPRYANELVVASLQSFLADKDAATTAGQLSPTGTAPSSSAGTGGVGMTLNKLRLTKSFLYKATRRSGEQAEAAFQAVVGAVSHVASSATGGGATEVVFDGEDWTDAADYGMGGSMFNSNASSHNTSIVSGGHERRQPFASLFSSLDDRISIPRASRLKTPRAFIPGSSSGNGPKSGNGIDDLKNMKANIGSSLNSSIGKVKRRFRTLSGHPNDPQTPGSAGGAFSSTQAAARMMKKPGILFQKALRRGDGPMMSPMSPTNSIDEVLTPPPLHDDELNLSGGDSSEAPSPTRASDNLANEELADADGCGDGEDEVDEEEEHSSKPAVIRERVVELLDKAIASYVRMCQERPEMRSSARSRELFEVLSAMEDFFMLGFSDFNADADEAEMMMATQMPFGSPRGPGIDITSSSSSRESGNQQYWSYLAQDRPETPFLNEHWRFVSSKCPKCVDSDSFCSTRGVQWILVALEKGMLWEYVTALHLNQKLTERFYHHDESIFRNGKLMESVLKSLFQLNKLSIALEIPYLLGRMSEMDEAFGVSSPSIKRANRSASTGSAATVRVLESVWEVERYVPIHGWTKAHDKRWQELPSSEWIWEGDWTLETKKQSVSSSVDSPFDAEAASGQAWEYAKTFEDRFHDKEKKFDSVRRRKWVRRRRQLPPVLSLGVSLPLKPASSSRNPSYTGGSTIVSSPPPALFGAASRPVAPTSTIVSLGAGKVRNIKHFFDSSKRGKAKTDETAVASPSPRTLMKRRSNSFDKSILSSPIADLALALESPDKFSLTPTKTSSPGKKKRGSIPSLRRSSTATSEKDVKSALSLTRSTTTGSTSSALDSSINRRFTLDVDDDDNVCFRCLTPLQVGNVGVNNSSSSSTSFSTCQSCEQRVCSSCHGFFAFLVFPPPLEASKKAQVCGSCYDRLTGKYRLKIEAHVGKYFIRDRDRDSFIDGASSSAMPTPPGGLMSHSSGSAIAPQSSSAAGGGGGSDSESSNMTTSNSSKSAVPKFEITVFVKDEASYAWSVVKTFQDFEALEKKLHEKLKKQEKKHGAGCHACHWKGVDYMELLAVEPSLKKLPIAALSYEKRLYVLEEFVQSLLVCDTLGQSPAVQKFLALSNAASVAAASVVGLHALSSSAANGSASTTEFRGEYPSSPTAGSLFTAGSGGGGGGAGGAGSSASNPMLMMENGKWRKGKWVAPESSSKETKMRILQKLEVSLFAVVGEVFEFDGIGMVRRQLFAMSRSFIKAFLSASHFRKLERQYLSFTDAKKMAAMIVDFREYMFPDPEAPPIPVPPATLSAQEMQALRKDALDAILASCPSTLVSLFGETSCENAALKLHEFLQHEVFVKNLLFSVADEVLLHLFPDFATFKPKPQPAGSAAAAASTK